MAKEITTGLIVAEESVAWSTLQGVRNRAQETDQGDFPLPKADDTESAEAHAGIIGDVLKEHSSRFKGRISLGIPTDQVLLKVLELPGVEDEDLPGIVEIQADKLSPFPIENMVVSHEVLHRSEEGMRVLIAAVQVREVEKIGARLTDLGLSVRRVDVEVMGWMSVLADAGEIDSSGRQILILMTGSAPTIVLLNDGVPQVVRSIKSCGGIEGRELADELGREINFTLMSRELAGDADDIPPVTVFSSHAEMDTLQSGLKESCGASVTVKNLDELPQSARGVANRAAMSRGGAPAASALLDLTPPSWSAEHQSAVFKRKMIQAAAAIIGVWLLVVGSLLGFLYYEERQLDTLKAEHATISEPAKQVRLLRRRARTIESYVDHSQSALECLREIASLLPDGIDLTSFSYRKNDQVKVSGIGNAVVVVYDFKNRLDESDFFPVAELNGPRTTKKGETFDVTFSLTEQDS